jgi:chromosome segregation ATPase
VALQTVSFKLPEDEVTELEREANQEGKSRSELIRSVLRARHIEEQLEEQVLTQQDKREYENRIAELERRAEELERKLKTRTAEVEAMEGTIEATVDEAVRSVRSDYEDRVEDLKEENQELRDRKVTGLEEANEELADAINDVLAEIATSEQVSGLSEMVEEKADRQWQGTTEQRESLIELREEVRDDLRRDVKRARPLTTKIADWVRHRLP